jgi:hypothetical protein
MSVCVRGGGSGFTCAWGGRQEGGGGGIGIRAIHSANVGLKSHIYVGLLYYIFLGCVVVREGGVCVVVMEVESWVCVFRVEGVGFR